MSITADRLVTDIATDIPATIAVFQRHRIEFCCAGRIPVREVCERHGLDEDSLLQELEEAATPAGDDRDWREASLTALVAHIQQRYHAPLRAEFPRLHAMLSRVLVRHGGRYGARLYDLRDVFEKLQRDLLAHMHKEDTVVFPVMLRIDADPSPHVTQAVWLTSPLHVMEAEHAAAGSALARIRMLTDDYVPPAGACPTFRGLYHGLAQLEADLQVHVHLENEILFPRAIEGRKKE